MNKEKCDAVLGKKVHEHLVSIGLETPMNIDMVMFDSKEKIATLTSLFEQVLDTIGLDRKDDSIEETPKRVAKMYVNEIYSGMNYNNFPKCTTVINKMKYDEMVIEKNIRVLSTCEHHLVTFDGHVNIAYIPKDKVLGLSKLPRICKYFARRPQVQERLSVQILEALKFILDTDNVAVSMTAKHYCVISRGVEDTDAMTTTNALSGIFKTDPSCRAEFFASIKDTK